MLEGVIGSVGMIILLAGGWILIGVFINRNFINTVNSAGNAVVGQGGKLVDTLRRKTLRRDGEPLPVEPEPVPEPAADPRCPSLVPRLRRSPLRCRRPIPSRSTSSIRRSCCPRPHPRIMPDPVVAEPSEPIDLFEERRGDMDQLEEELRRMEAPLRAAVAADEEDPFREIPVEGEASPEEPAETVGGAVARG